MILVCVQTFVGEELESSDLAELSDDFLDSISINVVEVFLSDEIILQTFLNLKAADLIERTFVYFLVEEF